MIAVALTGRMGAGKSEALKRIQENKHPVFEADRVAKSFLSQRSSCYPRLKSLFGEACLLENGEFDVKTLAQEIFSDNNKLKAMESIIHPEVKKKWSEFLEIKSRELYPFAFCEIPFFKKGIKTEGFDFVILVVAPEDLMLKRLIQKGISKKEVESRWKNQMLDSEFLDSADFIIKNEGCLEDLNAKVDQVLKKLKDKVRK